MNRYLWVIIAGLPATSQLCAQDIDYSQLQQTQTVQAHDDSIIAIAVSPDGKTLATSSYDETVRLWDLASGKATGKLLTQETTVRAFRFSPDGTILAAAGKDKTIRLWDVPTWKLLATIQDASERTISRCILRYSPDGKTLASATNDRTIRLWDVPSGNAQCTIQTGHRAPVKGILFSPDGKLLASNGYYDLKIWDTAGKELGVIKGRLSTMRFSDDGKRVTSAIGHKITNWLLASDKEPVIVEGETYRSYNRFLAQLSPDGKTLATVDKDLVGVNLGRAVVPGGKQRCRLILMDAATGNSRTILEKRGSANWFGPIWYSPNGQALLLWNWNEKSFTLVDIASGKQLAQITAPPGGRFTKGTIPPIQFTPDGKSLIAAHGPSVTVWAVP